MISYYLHIDNKLFTILLQKTSILLRFCSKRKYYYLQEHAKLFTNNKKNIYILSQNSNK